MATKFLAPFYFQDTTYNYLIISELKILIFNVFQLLDFQLVTGVLSDRYITCRFIDDYVVLGVKIVGCGVISQKKS